jgi:hypothetical protein
MGKRANMTSKEYLINAPLPEATETYTVVPHKDVMEKTEQTLEKMGFEIEREFFRCNQDAKVAQGIYHLKYGDDPDIGILFAWNNSYDKTTRFKCCTGGYVHESLASIVNGNMGNYARKHTGSADNDVLATIEAQLLHAEDYFKELLVQKDKMQNMKVSKKMRAELVGRMYFEQNLLTSEQMTIIHQQFDKASNTIAGETDTVWYMYHAIILALQKSHPRTWIEQQIQTHYFMESEFNMIETKQDDFLNVFKPEEVSNQITILDVIAEVEAEQPGEPAPWEDEAKTAEIQAIFNEPLEIRVAQEDVVGLEEELVPGTVIELFSPMVGEDDSVDDEGWPCVSCNEMQGAEAVWNDGQLCSKCADASMITNFNLDL